MRIFMRNKKRTKWGLYVLHKLIVTNSNNYNVIILSSIYILLFRTGCQSNVFNTGCYFYSFCDWLVNFWLEGFSSFWIPRKLVEKKTDSITFCIIPSGLYTNNMESYLKQTWPWLSISDCHHFFQKKPWLPSSLGDRQSNDMLPY